MADLDEEIDRLYGLPLEQFVSGRDALAKRLRGEKRRKDADAVKALRKPTVAAWAANQVLRSQPDGRRALLEAGDALRAAQEDLLAGRGDAAAARSAAEGERRAVGDLVSAARGLARDEGFLSDAVLDRVRETLHAAATDDDARAEVEAARLDRERRPAAFGGVEGFAVAPPARARAAPTKRPRPAQPAHRKPAVDGEADREREAEREAERERRAAERDRRRELQAALREAKAAERDAGRRRREAERAAHDAERQFARARADLDAAEAAEREAAARRQAAEEALAEG
ncbi:MAG: hypothetical protein ACJ76T_06695 [Solirubrobacteraceae bacterium]